MLLVYTRHFNIVRGEFSVDTVKFRLWKSPSSCLKLWYICMHADFDVTAGVVYMISFLVSMNGLFVDRLILFQVNKLIFFTHTLIFGRFYHTLAYINFCWDFITLWDFIIIKKCPHANILYIMPVFFTTVIAATVLSMDTIGLHE
jgi:hypothetical protein